MRCSTIASCLFLSGVAIAQAPVRYRTLPAQQPLSHAEGVAGDFDGDGHVDLLSRPPFGAGAFLARGDGNGNFAPQEPFGSIAANHTTLPLRTMAVADFDQDGRDDVVAVEGPSARVFLSRPGGLLPVALPVAVPCQNALLVPAVGDVDQDGNPDILFARTVCHPTIWLATVPGDPVLLRNLGGGAFTPVSLPPVQLAATWNWLTDIDRDGDTDLVFLQTTSPFQAPSPQGRVIVLRQDQPLVFTAVVALAQSAVPATAFENAALGDIDGDLDDDLVITTANAAGEVLQNSAGAFLRLGAGPQTTGDQAFVHLHDVDGDGRAEALVVPTPHRLEVWRLQGTSMVHVRDHGIRLANETWLGTTRPVFADIDDDRDLDVVKQAPFLWFGDARGGFEHVATGPSRAMPFGRLVDVDGDGFVDQLGLTSDGALAVGLNDGSGRMHPQDWSFPQLAWSPAEARVVQPFDYDADGDLDLLIPDIGHVLRRDGTTFSVAQTFPPADHCVRAPVVDLDGDGDRDVLLVRRYTGSSPLEWLKNNGGGSWQRLWLGWIAELFDIQPCHADGDGLTDLLVVGTYDSRVGHGASALLRNHGNGSILPDPAFPALAAWTGAVGDLDGDGDDDFVLDGTIVRNDGTSFPTQPLLPNGRVWAITDVDRDGRRDIVVADNTTLFVFRQHPAMTFTVSEQQPIPDNHWPQFPTLIGMLDVDRDGDLDLVTPTAFFADTGHQLTRTETPRLGRPSTKVLMGAPGTLVALAAAFGRADLPRPPFGTFFLDPATTVVQGIGALPANGEFGFGLAIPDVPALEGLELFWQAAFLDGPWLSNLEPTRIGAR